MFSISKNTRNTQAAHNPHLDTLTPFIWKPGMASIMLGVAPFQDASDHQDYEPFLIGNPELNLHLPLESCEGATPNHIWEFC